MDPIIMHREIIKTSRLSLEEWGEMSGPWRLDEFVTGWGDLGVWCVGVDGLLVVGSTVVVLCRLFCFDSDWDCRGDCERESGCLTSDICCLAITDDR